VAAYLGEDLGAHLAEAAGAAAAARSAASDGDRHD
jgi:hypothetical protein